jgi:hypothetical protein
MQTDRQTDNLTDRYDKASFCFLHFANAPKMCEIHAHWIISDGTVVGVQNEKTLDISSCVGV